MSAAIVQLSTRLTPKMAEDARIEAGKDSDTKPKRDKRTRRRSSISGEPISIKQVQVTAAAVAPGEDNKKKGRKKPSDRATRSLSPVKTNIASDNNEALDGGGRDELLIKTKKKLIMPIENNIEDPELLPVESNIEDPDDPLLLENNIEDPDDLRVETNIDKLDGLTPQSHQEEEDRPINELHIEEAQGTAQSMEKTRDSTAPENSTGKSKKPSSNKQKKSLDNASGSLPPADKTEKEDKEDMSGKLKKKKPKKLGDRAARSLSPMRSDKLKKSSNNKQKQDTLSKKNPLEKERKDKEYKKTDKKETIEKGERSPNNIFSERKRKMKVAGRAVDTATRPLPPPRSNSSEKSRSPRDSQALRKSNSMDDNVIEEMERKMAQKLNEEQDNNQKTGLVIGLSPARAALRQDRQIRRANRRASMDGPVGGAIMGAGAPMGNANVANFVNEERKEQRRASRRASLSGPMSTSMDISSSTMDRRKMENEKRAYIRARMRGENPVADRGNLIRTKSAPSMRRLKSILYTRETPRRNVSLNVKFAEEDPTMFVIPDLTNEERIELYYSRKDIKMFKIDDINRKQRELEMEEQLEQEQRKG